MELKPHVDDHVGHPEDGEGHHDEYGKSLGSFAGHVHSFGRSEDDAVRPTVQFSRDGIFVANNRMKALV